MSTSSNTYWVFDFVTVVSSKVIKLYDRLSIKLDEKVCPLGRVNVAGVGSLDSTVIVTIDLGA